MGKDASTEIRSSRLHEVGGMVIAFFIRLIGSTLKIEFKGTEKMENRWKNSPVIYALWHNRLFILAYAWQKRFPERKVVALTSASKDGAALETVVGEFGIEAVRGSSSRRGIAALVGLKKAVREGKDAAITPDGPRGPKYEVQPGVVKLAQSSGCPIVIVGVEYSATWKLNSWDSFLIPIPFSRVRVNVETFEVPKRLNEEEFEETRFALEVKMQNVSG